MRVQSITLAGIVTLGLLLSACGTTHQQQGHVLGSVIGGVLGSKLGSGSGRIAGSIAGTLFGGYVGSNIGKQMDDADRYRAGEALERNPTDQPSSWKNPDTGHAYTITPTRTYYADSQPCRDYTTEAWIDGQPEVVRGTACRQPDGSWAAAN